MSEETLEAFAQFIRRSGGSPDRTSLEGEVCAAVAGFLTALEALVSQSGVNWRGNRPPHSPRKAHMPRIPRDRSLDSTLAVLLDPYGFISNRCRKYRTDLFETRLMLRRTICMTGPSASEVFYDQRNFVRRGAMPERIRRTLIGRGGVQGLDDAEHQHRKQMFMSLMTPERIGELAETVLHWMRAYSRNWAAMDRVKLGDELPEILTRAACAWSGIALEEREVETRTRQLTAMFSYAGSVGPKHW